MSKSPPKVQLLTVERLLRIEAVDLKTSLSQAATILAEILGTDKIDIYLYEHSTTTLVSYGVSDTPMGQQQKALGLERLPLANGTLLNLENWPNPPVARLLSSTKVTLENQAAERRACQLETGAAPKSTEYR